jgi:hypothetical protein
MCTKFDKVEAEFKIIIADKAKLKEIWRALDFNGNRIVSLAEIDKMVVEKYTILNHKPALMRAYKRATSKAGGGDGDDWVEPNELQLLLEQLVFFNRIFWAFDEVDVADDRRVDLKEFLTSCPKLGLSMTPEEMTREFNTMDKNKGGQVLFDEFCEWYLKKKGVKLEEKRAMQTNRNFKNGVYVVEYILHVPFS